MTENVNARIINKHDTENNWNKAVSLIPKLGELIIYDKDENYDYARIKIGDGVTSVILLPFALDSVRDELLSSGVLDGEDGYTPVIGTDYWTLEDKAEIQAYIDEAIAELPSGEVVNNDDAWITRNFTTYENDKITSVAYGAFAYFKSLTYVNLPNCSYIGKYAFASCKSLANINLPACTSIDEYAFRSCEDLTGINFPECSYLRYAFIDCSSLTYASIPKCVSIDYMTFARCSSLSSIILPPSCSIIASSAFINCSCLSAITLQRSSVIKLSNINAFRDTPMSNSALTGAFGSIYVPASLVDAYKSATNWATYADRITAIVEE